MIVNKQLSDECREVISELKRAMKSGKIHTDVTALALSGGYVWGAIFSYRDDEGVLVAEETYYTMKGSTRRVSGFVVLFDDDSEGHGVAFDGEMYNPLLPEKSKTISDFVIGLIGESITPSLLTMMHAGLEESIECNIHDNPIFDGSPDDPESVYPCTECEDAGTPECNECECPVCDTPTCTEEIRLACDNDPFKDDEDDEDDEDDDDDDDDEDDGEE